MAKYKNLTDQDQTIIGVGLIPAGAEFTTSLLIENPNFKLVDETTTPAPTPEPALTQTQTNEETN